MKKGILILLALLAFIDLKAQDINTKKNTLTRVFNSVVNAYGNAKTAPALDIVPKTSGEKYIATYIATPNPVIKVDEQLFDLCMQMGADSLNALSIILSHELAHYYNDHSWCSDFAFAVRSKIKSTKDDKITHEREADNFGLYHSCIAGYHPFNIYDRLLDKIYNAYQLNDKNPDYPTKNERKLICKEAEKKIKDLYPVFEKGIASIKNGRYDTAIECFEYLNKYFPSRENYNNAGTAKTLWALKYKPLERIEYENPAFRYPIEFDPESRLKTNGSRNLDEETAQKMEALLNTAKKDFEKAISLDPVYDRAFINLACVYDLLGNPEAAIGKIKELPLNKQNQKSAFTILGIAYYHGGNEEKSKKMFEKASLY